MNRRTAIRDLIIFAGGVTLVPSCVNHPDAASIVLNKINIDAGQEAVLGEIAATIIPQTTTLGAKEVNAHLFVLKMVDDCYEEDVQQKFIRGLDQVESDAKKRFGKSFGKCTEKQREDILLAVENGDSASPEVSQFYEIMKARTIQGYLTSKYVLENIKKYEMIPSVQYDGYYPIKNLKKEARDRG